MPNPSATIRHARTAISLLINGAIREIEAEVDSKSSDYNSTISDLLDHLSEAVDEWRHEGSLLDKLQAALADDSDVPADVREAARTVLTFFNELP